MLGLNPLSSQAMRQRLSSNIVMPFRRPNRPLVVVAGRQAETRRMLKVLLEMWDYDVAEVSGLQDSVAIAASDRPTAVLVDGFLPMADCLAEVEEAKKSKCMAGIPLIVLSGFSRERVGQGVKDSGAEGLMVKPLDFDALERLLKYFSAVGGNQFD